MFGREQPDVVTGEDVGDYIKELQRQGTTEVNTFIMEDHEEDEEDEKSEKPKPTTERNENT